jgi:hypothetical protein
VDEHFTPRRVLSTFWRIMIGGSMTTKATITAALAALLLTASCSGKPEVLEPGEQRTSVSPSARASAEPTLSSQARQISPEGAVAFTRDWVEHLNYAMQVGATDGFDRLSEASCTGCRAYRTKIAHIYRDGGHYSKGEWTISDIEVEYRKPVAYVYFSASWNEGSVQASKEASVERVPAGNEDLVMKVVARGGSWSAAELSKSGDGAPP